MSRLVPRRCRRVAAIVLLALPMLAAVACGGQSDGGNGMELADRLMRLGEERDTKVEVLPGELPPDLSEALNPSADPETPDADLVKVPVHPDGRLLGSFRLERSDGVVTFFLLYDVPGAAADIESSVAQQLDQSPWQVSAGQSTEAISTVRFQSTVSEDIDGTAAMREVDAEDDSVETSVVYILEVQPAQAVDEQPFQLPAARPLPDGFPPAYVIDGATPISIQWSSDPTGSVYQLVILSKDSTSDVADRYRQVMGDDGWELQDDQAQGFATVLSYQKNDGASQASLSIDAFSEDDSYTAVFFSIQLGR